MQTSVECRGMATAAKAAGREQVAQAWPQQSKDATLLLLLSLCYYMVTCAAWAVLHSPASPRIG
jgi:hypothetical protein